MLSFFNLTKHFKSVHYDNQVRDAFIVTRDDDTIMEFVPSKEGLYHYKFLQSINRQRNVPPAAIQAPVTTAPSAAIQAPVMMVQTVEEIKRNFSKREVENAEEARRLYVIVGRPGRNICKEILRKGNLINNAMTVQDYRNIYKFMVKILGY